jgi:hypothetical protein
MSSAELEVRKIVGKRCNAKGTGKEYKIQWKGFAAEDDIWCACAFCSYLSRAARLTL